MPQILHVTDGFTSSPKEVVLLIFIAPKNPIVLGRICTREPCVQWQACYY
jgi:hypothetical protein